MASIYNFKKIAVVPTSNDFLDIVLSKTQRKTPTVIHKNYAISRIRNFYMRKVKFTQDSFEEKLNGITEEFPLLDSIHPFYADLMNVLYDKDHYKLALGQINTAKHMIGSVAKDYVKLLKFGDSLYRCKQLKKAALGRMATIMKRQKDSLVYLEQVRQHLARLPSIDPNTRTLLVCGYPNVGKSSFLNKITRADVDVQPYAFTTKSLFVGHMDYKYLRWQVIDTPGILDHPLEERNTIEMQSITALAHLRACIMFFMDLSEQCGYSIADQCSLFNSIKPLFANKPTLLVINKIDIVRLEDLSPSDQALIKEIVNGENTELVQLSCYTDEGVMDVRNAACDRLLASRVEQKMQSNKIGDVLNKLHLAQPQTRDNTNRPAHIPEGALDRIKYDLSDPNRPKLERDVELENGGAGVYNVDLKKRYMLSNDEWKYDYIPEIMDGKNVADFVDPDIEEQLEALEREEERLIEEGFYDSDGGMTDPEEEAIRSAATEIRKKKQLIINASRDSKGKNRTTLIKKIRAQLSTKDDLKKHMASLDLDPSLALQHNVRSKKRGRSLASSKQLGEDDMDIDDDVSRAVSRAPTRDRSMLGVRDVTQKMESVIQGRKSRRRANLMAKAGEADRSIQTKMPKHLFSGKRKGGTTDRR